MARSMSTFAMALNLARNTCWPAVCRILEWQHVITSKQMFSPSRSQSSQSTRYSTPTASSCRCLTMWPFSAFLVTGAEKSEAGSTVSQFWYACGKSMENTCPTTDVTTNVTGLPRKVPSNSCTGGEPR